MTLSKDTVKEAFEDLKKSASRESIDTLADQIRKAFPGIAHLENEVYGFAVNRYIGQIYGGGETEALLRIENDLAKWLGYTFETQQDKLDKEGFYNKIPSLI